ncbi:MAG: 50S ribosomal protein L17 [Anaerolineaceae bacterium]|jgi:large subunit ribosomal protein L17|nr:MAG: 50S ribosomal protein L17 [Anaerolineaceae bacterium]
MRHQVAGKKLNRNSGNRKALRSTLIKQLFTHDKIKTTRAKAQAIRGEAEKLITIARNSSKGTDIDKVNARRLAASKLNNAAAVKRLFDNIAPRFENRNGGYTRMIKLGPRKGDDAEMVLLELVENEKK